MIPETHDQRVARRRALIEAAQKRQRNRNIKVVLWVAAGLMLASCGTGALLTYLLSRMGNA